MDLESQNGHMIILDIGTKNLTRIVNLYRSFNPRTCSEKDFFTNQLTILSNIMVKKIEKYY